MTYSKEFEFEAFEDNFDLATGEPSEWPALTVSVDYNMTKAEPDVNWPAQADVHRVTYYMEGDAYTDDTAFAHAVYQRIGDEIDATVEAVLKVIRDQVDDWTNELDAE